VKAFFQPDRLQQMERTIPGWGRMAGFANGATLVHVAVALAALQLSPEYRQAARAQKNLFQWIVLLHDIGKEAQPGKRDAVHAFRSAVIAARALPRLGFPVMDDFAGQVEAWADLTLSATLLDANKNIRIQDNRKLPKILAGIDRLFGMNTAPGLIVKAILLHLSVNTNRAWPQAAPLSEAEIKQYVDADLLPYLKMLMLIDNDAWEFFDPEKRTEQRREVLSAFHSIQKAIEAG